MEFERCIATENKHDKEILPLRSPSSWSYDAMTRSMNIYSKDSSNTFKNQPNNFYKNTMNGSSNSIISLLNECEFSPLPSHKNTDSYLGNSTNDSDDSYESMPSNIDISMPSNTHKLMQNRRANNKNYDATNSTQMMAGLVLLCISGVLDAGNIAYINWLMGVGFNMVEILMYQGIVQIVLCFIFGVITAKVMSTHNFQRNSVSSDESSRSHSLSNDSILHRNASFRSLVLPFSAQYNVNLVKFCKQKRSQRLNRMSAEFSNRYGATNHIQTGNDIRIVSSSDNHRQIIIAIIAFGIVQFTSHLLYFIGYLKDTQSNHFEIAPLFNSLAILLAFVWSLFIFYDKLSLNSEVFLYLFLMYIGVFICGYSFIKYSTNHFGIIIRVSNLYLIGSAFFESLGYVLIKYAANIPTFILVFSQSVFCGILGLILFETSNDSFEPLTTFSDVIEMSSIGLIGFWSTWSFVRGTQLISIGTASFLKMTFFIIFSIVIQVFSVEGQIPHFYCIFGLCLILLSIVLMLVEKFSKFRQAKKSVKSTEHKPTI